MGRLDSLGMMGIFKSVEYNSELKDNSVCGKFENAANTCRRPGLWFAKEVWSGGYTYKILDKNNLTLEREQVSDFTGTTSKILRIIIGGILGVLGNILALPLMGIAYISREIRLKHTAPQRMLSPAEVQELGKLIDQRKLDEIEAAKKPSLWSKIGERCDKIFNKCRKAKES